MLYMGCRGCVRHCPISDDSPLVLSVWFVNELSLKMSFGMGSDYNFILLVVTDE